MEPIEKRPRAPADSTRSRGQQASKGRPSPERAETGGGEREGEEMEGREMGACNSQELSCIRVRGEGGVGSRALATHFRKAEVAWRVESWESSAPTPTG
jgi:hypothetical protein